MAITNHDRVGKALELLKAGIGPFVERETKAALEKKELSAQAVRSFADDPKLAKRPLAEWDVAALLKLMWETWNEVFRKTLGPAERSLVGELRGHRNRWAHQESFSSDDAYRALDSASRLLTAVSASQSEDVERMKTELLRVRFDEQARSERRKGGSTLIESPSSGSLKPWREVVTPHPDVASGRYQQAEFAADLWQVHLGEGTEEYRNPVEFFRRTFPTESLKRLMTGAARRVSAKGGDPVVQLQTNFGGGKTHSMLALYHLFSGTRPTELLGIDGVLADAQVDVLPKVNRVVLVGNKISPGSPVKKPDGTVVSTLWGEVAWQLGDAAGGVKEAKKAYKRIQADDEKATNPGDALRELFNDYGPCLVLIDEWVAYARQLHDGADLPAGSFDTQFTFAQALTESAKLAKHCMLVISLPASDSGASPGTLINDVEVGGQRGRDALSRLQNVVGRVESSWRPASAEEGFEIVRRRLFEPLADREQWVARDTVARAYFDFYRAQRDEFPPECRESDYEARLKAAYPIHPEVFDRLYNDWSTLVKFQRTRGVLRLMAAVIHCLWEKGDRNPMIQPANLPIDDPRVQFEMTRYLSDNWVPILEKDVDGPQSLPSQLDGANANLGKFSACRRVARTIYLGSAPTTAAANRGIEDRRVKLGCAMPGESPAVFGDALRRLASTATYLYQDGPRYWYSTQPTVTKLAEDRAEQLKREPDKIAKELEARLRADLRQAGDFTKVHPLPQSGADVSDDRDARLVVLGAEQAHSKESGSAAEIAAKAILTNRGNAPRLYQNALVFLAPDNGRMQELQEAIRGYLAWESVVDDKDTLNLDPHQVRQAETQRDSTNKTVAARLPEAFMWLLVPFQSTPQATLGWHSYRLAGQEPLAVRVSKKLRGEELLISRFAGTRLKMELDNVPLWRGDNVPVRQLVDDFARYLYLPRLIDGSTVVQAVQDGVSLLTWDRETFAYADSFDEAAGRYRGLRGGQQIRIAPDDSGLVVKPDVARRQIDEDTKALPAGGASTQPPGAGTGLSPSAEPAAASKKLTRFFGTVELDATRAGRDAGRIADEVISHLSGLVGANVKVTLEIQAEIPEGASEQVVRTVTENSRTLKFKSQGFERE